MDPLRTKIALTALTTRLGVFLFSILSNLFIPDHKSADAFEWTPSPGVNGTKSRCDAVVEFLTRGLVRWDAEFFLHIANNGYSYENTLAFFPLYPMTVRAVGEVVHWMQVDYNLIHFSSSLRIAALLVNAACFALAALALFELSRKVLKDEYLAYKSALFFTVNPAAVFFSAAYSETMHAAIAFYVMLKVERAFTFQMGFLLVLASATRANGFLNAGFAVYKGVRYMIREVVIHQRLKQLERSELSETIVNMIGDGLLPASLSLLCSLGPFALFQWYGFTEYCGVTKPKFDYDEAVINYGVMNGLKLPSADPSPWCQDAIPISYSYIQSHYWGVGLFRYWHWRQIPNFLLAVPMLYLVLAYSWKFCKCHSFYASRLGFTYFSIDPAQKVPPFSAIPARTLPRNCFPYVVHAVALTLLCVTSAHVQIVTRMICSSSPLVYWLAALLTTDPKKKPTPLLDLSKEDMCFKIETKEHLEHNWKSVVTEEVNFDKESKWIKGYFGTYAIVGVILFSNGLPWT